MKRVEKFCFGLLTMRSTLSQKVIKMQTLTAFLTDPASSGKKGSLGAFPSKVILELLF